MTEQLLFNLSLLNISYSDLDIIKQLATIHQVFQILIPVLIGLLMGVGLIVNLLVFFVTISPSTKRFKKRPIHSLFVLNLATADIIYLLSSGPFKIVNFSQKGWRFGEKFCPVFHFLRIWTMSVSIFTMCGLASFRFCGIVAPFRFKSSFIIQSKKWSLFFIFLLLWIGGASLAIPNLVYFVIIKKGKAIECTWKDTASHDVYWIVLVSLTYVIPFFLVTILYMLITVQIRLFIKRKRNSM